MKTKAQRLNETLTMAPPDPQEKMKTKAAKEYVEKQLATMKRFGSAPKLSKSEVKEIIRKVVQALP